MIVRIKNGKVRRIKKSDIQTHKGMLQSEIARLESIQNDDKELLSWAKDNFESTSGLLELKESLQKQDKLLSQIAELEA